MSVTDCSEHCKNNRYCAGSIYSGDGNRMTPALRSHNRLGLLRHMCE